MNEIIFWGGPKDGHIEYQNYAPSTEVYCLDHASPLIDIFDVYALKKSGQLDSKVYSIYVIKKLAKGKYKYIFNGLI